MLGGQVFGLTKGEVVLENNGQVKTVPVNSSSYFFDQMLRNDEDFNVTIKSWPASMTCSMSNNKGRTGSFSIQNANLSCFTNPYALGGEIKGLDNASGLVLVNGADQIVIPAGAVEFTMPAMVGDGSPYGVTILAQPAGRSCTVVNGVGTMGNAAVKTVLVTCVAA
jgi:hypothetical protein